MVMHQLFVDFKKAYDTVRTVAFRNILFEFCILKPLERLTKMCLTEAQSRFRMDKFSLRFFQLGML
jgi:hypothetical protein